MKRLFFKGTIADVSNAVKSMAEQEEQDQEQVEVELNDIFKLIFKSVLGI